MIVQAHSQKRKELMGEILEEVKAANAEWQQQAVALGVPSKHLDQRVIPKEKAPPKAVSLKRPHMEWGDQHRIRTSPPSSSSFTHFSIPVLNVFTTAQTVEDN